MIYWDKTDEIFNPVIKTFNQQLVHTLEMSVRNNKLSLHAA